MRDDRKPVLNLIHSYIFRQYFHSHLIIHLSNYVKFCIVRGFIIGFLIKY